MGRLAGFDDTVDDLRNKILGTGDQGNRINLQSIHQVRIGGMKIMVESHHLAQHMKQPLPTNQASMTKGPL